MSMNPRWTPAALVLLTGSTHALGAWPLPAGINPSSLNGTNGFVLNEIEANYRSGWSVSSAGDVNGDGYDDVIVGARYANPNGLERAGESYVVFGGPGVGAGGAINLSSLNGANGFVLNGALKHDESGFSVSSAGDVNDDGYDDIIIGAPYAGPNGQAHAGASFVVFGGPGVGAGGAMNLSSLNGTNGFVLNGIKKYDESAHSVSSAGDVNGDGYDDVIVGAWLAGPNGQAEEGASYVVFGGPAVGGGSAAGAINLSSLNGTNGFMIKSTGPGRRSGASVSSAGDVNGDGIDDLMIGAWSTGESYVVFGGHALGAAGVIGLSSLNGSNGFVLIGSYMDNFSGISVSSAGDVNGDGYDDVIAGVPFANAHWWGFPGATYVVFGPNLRHPHFCPADIDGDAVVNVADFNILAAHFGREGVSGADGDLNGDGSVDVSDFNLLAAGFGCEDEGAENP